MSITTEDYAKLAKEFFNLEDLLQSRHRAHAKMIEDRNEVIASQEEMIQKQDATIQALEARAKWMAKEIARFEAGLKHIHESEEWAYAQELLKVEWLGEPDPRSKPE